MSAQLFRLPGHIMLATVFSCSVLLWPSASGLGKESADVLIVAEDYRFSGPDRIAGGWHVIQLRNRGRDTHHVQFLKLSAGNVITSYSIHYTKLYDCTKSSGTIEGNLSIIGSLKLMLLLPV